MKRTRKWHKKLTIKEIRHVNEFMGGTIRSFRAARVVQKKCEKKFPKEFSVCFDCNIIARKLGIEA
jgi:hypothetical protein